MSPHVRRVLFGNFLSQLGSGLTFALLVVYLGQVRGLGTAVAGIVIAYMALVALMLTPVNGTAIDRYGPRPVLMGGLLANAVGAALLPRVDSTASAVAVATVVTLGAAFTWSAQSALLGRLTEPSQRQRVFGIQFLLLNLGLGIGGILSAAIVRTDDPSTFTRLYLIDALSYLAYIVVLLTMRGVGVGRAPIPEGMPTTGPGGYREVIADRVLLRITLLSLVLLTCGYGAFQVALPVFITQISGLAVSWVAIAYTVNTAVIVVLQLFVLRRMEGRSRTRMLAGVAALWGLTWVLLGISGTLPSTAAIAGACISAGVFALGEMLWAPIGPALVNDLAPDHLRGRYNSVSGLVWGVGGSLGPAVTGILLGRDLVLAWVLVVVAGCAWAGLMAVRLGRHLTPALDGRLPSTSASGTMSP